MKLLAIHDGHNASVALMENGQIIFAIQEERLVREKNRGGFPYNALKEVLQQTNTNINDIDKFVFVGYSSAMNMINREAVLRKYENFFNYQFTSPNKSFKSKIKKIVKEVLPEDFVEKVKYKKIQKRRMKPLKEFGIKDNKIVFLEHHLCHAASAAYGWGLNEKFVVVTLDSSGDGISGTVNLFDGNKLKRLAEIKMEDSPARIYSLTTFYLGMVPMEHEYKLMGMAPYAENSRIAQEIANYFLSMYEFNSDLTFALKDGIEPVYRMGPRLEEFYRFKRFDYISAGLQMFIEKLITQWIKRILRTLNKNKIALAGGLFMNVKLNKRIMALDEVEDIFIFPSCGDESNVFGALYQYYFEVTGKKPQKLGPYYLGGDFSDDEIEKEISKFAFKNKVKIRNCEDIEKKIAELLATGEIVARFKGRMEFGARALGNRSILANPADYSIINTINKMIKSRDFWMPFAPSMLDERADEYIFNPKKIKAPYMILTFDTVPEKRDKFRAAIHPYDYTARPQIVYKDWNPDYWRLIKYFEDLTGEGVILNTSFNLHGYPIVYKPKEALEVFDKSGLKYLAIGNFLLEKI